MHTHTKMYISFLNNSSVSCLITNKNRRTDEFSCGIKCKQYQNVTFTDILKRRAFCTECIVGKIV